MRFFTNKQKFKKIIIGIIIVLSFNFVMPNYSHASFGGTLFKPISQFICSVGDLIIEWMQKQFMRYGCYYRKINI